MTNEEFLQGLTDSKASNRHLVFCVFDYIDKLAMANRFDTIDELLVLVDPSKYNSFVYTAFLAITFTMKDKLTKRSGLYNRTHAHILNTRPEDVKGLLGGLE